MAIYPLVGGGGLIAVLSLFALAFTNVSLMTTGT
jgi:hypothetical protein